MMWISYFKFFILLFFFNFVLLFLEYRIDDFDFNEIFFLDFYYKKIILNGIFLISILFNREFYKFVCIGFILDFILSLFFIIGNVDC